MGRRELVLMLLVGCNESDVDVPQEGTYSAAEPPDAKTPFESPLPARDATADAEDAADASADVTPVDAGTCVRDESRDHECVTYDGPDAAPRSAIRCPANEAGNPALPPPAIGCNYTGWADAGALTMCCK
jgi:hypothetical protein